MTKHIYKILTFVCIGFFIASIFAGGIIMSLNQVINPLLVMVLFFVCLGVAVIAFLGAFLFIFLGSAKEAKIRREELDKFTGEKGWKYRAYPKQMSFLPDIKNKLGITSLSEHPLDAKTQNLLSKNIDGRSVAVFDQIYHIGHGENRQEIEVTFFVLIMPKTNLPIFCCEPEGFWDKLSGAFADHDIDFADFPLFSKKYFLYGRDKSRIRQLFDETVLLEYQQHSLFTTIGAGNYLITYESGILCPPGEIEKKLNRLFRFAKLFSGKI
jgi:hypothetical protein